MIFASHGAPLALVVTMTPIGFVFGLVYFAALRSTVTRLAAGRPWLGAVALTVGRFAAAVALFSIAARWGAACLLAAFGGFLLARLAAVQTGRLARRAD